MGIYMPAKVKTRAPSNTVLNINYETIFNHFFDTNLFMSCLYMK